MCHADLFRSSILYFNKYIFHNGQNLKKNVFLKKKKVQCFGKRGCFSVNDAKMPLKFFFCNNIDPLRMRQMIYQLL